MTDLRVARRNLRQYRGRLVTLVLAVILGSVLSLVCIGLVGDTAKATQSAINEGVALRTVELKTDGDRPDVKQLQSKNLEAVKSTAHVVSVEPWAQGSFGIKTPTIAGALIYGTSIRPSAPPPVLRAIRETVFPLRPDEVLLPATSQGEDFDSLVGQQVPASYTRKIAEGRGEPATDTVTVAGVYDPSFAIDGPSAAYADTETVVRWASAKAGLPAADYASTIGYQKAYVIVDTSENMEKTLALLRAEGYAATSVHETLTSLPAGLQSLRVLGIAVFVLLLAYGAFAGTAISGSFMKSRTREIGLLNALGFRRGRIMRLLLLELLIVGGAAGLLGAVLGSLISFATGSVLSGSTVFGVTVPTDAGWPDWRWTLLILLAPPITVTIGGLLPAWRVARLQPDLALRGQV